MRSYTVDLLKSLPLYVLPHHAISRLVFWLTRRRSRLAQPVIRWFIRQFDVDMADAEAPQIDGYATFNEFFTRSMRADARPIADGQAALASPVDGTVSAHGPIEQGRLFQAKGHDYALATLLGGDEEAAERLGSGSFTTVYLAPRDYHRLHMPLTGTLLNQTHVPGRLFSVAPHTVRTVPSLFARNERVIAQFDTQEAGRVALVLVGAINVAAIETVWHGLVTPPSGKRIQRIDYPGEPAITLQRGQEMGRFNMGSTVIVVLERPVQWRADMGTGLPVRMGERLGTIAGR